MHFARLLHGIHLTEPCHFTLCNILIEPVHEISNNVVAHQQSLRSACAYAQSDQSLCLSLEYSMIVKLLTKHPLEFLRLKGGCTGSSESTHVKIPHCWKSHVTAQLCSTFKHTCDSKRLVLTSTCYHPSSQC